jgi:hypothetical protein
MQRLVIGTASFLSQAGIVIAVIIAFFAGQQMGSPLYGIFLAAVTFAVLAFVFAVFFCLLETAQNTKKIAAILEDIREQLGGPKADRTLPTSYRGYTYFVRESGVDVEISGGELKHFATEDRAKEYIDAITGARR